MTAAWRQILNMADEQSWQVLEDVLREGWPALDAPEAWPASQLVACGKCGVFSWFMPREWGGAEWSDVDLLRGYLRLSKACLTTAFVLTQRVAAVSRLLACHNEALKQELLPRLLTADTFATVGISHLTTSHRHLARPILMARWVADGFVLDGFSPWVTGANQAETIVTGATLEDGRQLLAAVDTRSTGVSIRPSEQLVALSASQTGRVDFKNVFVPRERVLAGPIENVMQQGLAAGTGGLTTSALAIGLADRALEILKQEAKRRDDLVPPTEALASEWEALRDDLLALADARPVCSTESLRQRANDLAPRAAQAALMATKGAGYVATHPAGRLCREALFFLVWSCPQPVTAAHLCELAGLH